MTVPTPAYTSESTTRPKKEPEQSSSHTPAPYERMDGRQGSGSSTTYHHESGTIAAEMRQKTPHTCSDGQSRTVTDSHGQ